LIQQFKMIGTDDHNLFSTFLFGCTRLQKPQIDIELTKTKAACSEPFVILKTSIQNSAY
jgi:hypothetical protein